MEQKKNTQETQQDFKSLTELFKWMKENNVPQDSDAWQINYERFLDLKARQTDAPTFGVFELTPQCNLDCQMCYVHLTKAQMGQRRELSFEQIKSLIEQAMTMGLMSIQLTGGEAMMHPDFDRIYLFCQEKGLRIALLTNGLLLTDQRIRFLQENPPSSLQITLYGWDDNSYKRVTGHCVYERVKENILKAKSIDCRFSIAATPSRYCKAEDIRNLIQFCNENDLRIRINNDLQIPYEETGRNLDDFNLTEDEFLEIKDLMVHDRKKLTDEELPDVGQFFQMEKGTKCAAGRALFCITWTGKLKPCFDLPIEAAPLEEGFKAAWEKVNRQIKNYAVPAECRGCAYVSVCNPCPALHSQGAEAGHADRRICNRTQRMVREGYLTLPAEGGGR